jgi:hypothetical protein
MKISAIAPVLNENPWIGYSIMAALPYFHEFIYALDEKSDDGTRDLLHYIKDKYACEKLIIIDFPNFHPHDMAAYNKSFNVCIDKMTGDAAMFLHPDMILTKGAELKEGSLAWWVTMTSFAGDFKTQITKGRATQWKNIHAKKFGLHYYGGYGSVNEDFYHRDITGNAYRHYGTEFSKYPFQVADSGIKINHYCELKPYKRRFEKMKTCLRTQNPDFEESYIEELAAHHPRVTLEPSGIKFGKFEFEEMKEQIPNVITKYEAEFAPFKKEIAYA